MKNKLFAFLLLGIFSISLIAFGQNPDYPTKKINGIDYYIYTVQASEGLYAISRKFDVTQADINTANPEIQNGLKVGQEIKIPVKKTVINEPNQNIKNSGIQIVQHKVESKQTLFAISKMYNVSQEDIKKYNPQIDKGLQTGVILQIPKKRVAEVKVPKEVKPISAPKPLTTTSVPAPKPVPVSPPVPTYITHIVDKKETLYSISKKYNVEIDEIVKLNPENGRRIKIGSEIKIPNKNQQKTQSEISVAQKSVLELKNLGDKNKTLNFEGNKKHIRLAFLLPFMLDNPNNEINIDRFTDFYSGALLAIQDAKEMGVSFDIYTYDTENTEQKMLEILSKSELKTVDLIIGPAFTNQVPLIGNFAKANKINTLIPFSSKIPDIEKNPYLFQFNPGIEVEMIFARDLFISNYKDYNIIFADIPNINNLDEGKKWASELKSELKKKNRKYEQIELNTPDYADFKSVLKSNVKNLIIFNTDKYAYVSPFISPMQTQSANTDLTLYEQYNWKSQELISQKGISISPFSITLSTVLPSKFNLKYLQVYGKQPSSSTPRFDVLGYDLCNYFVSLINIYDKELNKNIGNYIYSRGIQSQPLFKSNSENAGFINQRLYLVEHNFNK